MSTPTIPRVGANPFVPPVLDGASVSILTNAHHATVSVRTRSGSDYTVVKRPGWVTVVGPDGIALHGTGIYMIGGQMFLRDDDFDQTVLRTSTVVQVYVLAN